MVSTRGVVIGILVMIFGFIVMITALSPQFLFSMGILSVAWYNTIQSQFKIWGISLSILIIIIGLVVMGKVD
ncbi:MAG: hypothetical protein PHC66_04725 [Candidatus Nanoarchaeia archaeon]|nr:hypothetical protein [Candidatus Nanoarchaeia archaeon]MDD5238993.1 hypothetical protein [Candidatus Nanoarchaeia archaeon]